MLIRIKKKIARFLKSEFQHIKTHKMHCLRRPKLLVLLISCICVASAIREIEPSLHSPVVQHNNDEGASHELNSPDENTHTNSSHKPHIHLANWRWKEYGKLLTVISALILAGILKLLFHHIPILPNYMPESCVLILIGICMGASIYVNGPGEDHDDKTDDHVHLTRAEIYFPKFTSEIFFLVLLPPIILDSAYSMYDRQFLDNLGGVLLFAVVGTLFNAFFIGYGLYLAYYLGFMGELPEEINTIDCLKFASLIAATDPVAVLAIFQEIGVNISLYFMVFGESLFNDGISVVLYNSMVSLGKIESETDGGSVDKMNYVLAFFSFFTVVFGGLMIGIFIGLLTSLIVRFTKHTQVIEPFLVILMSYVSYVLSETVHWSGIISLIGCGVTQKRYAFLNISKSSLTTVKNSVKTLATFSDVIIFLFLGIVTISHNDLHWHWGFSLWTLFLCQLFRFAGVFLLTSILNHRLLKKISTKEQFIIAYGGLRGAVGFSLAIILSNDEPGKISSIFLTTTLFMVYFTVFVQGGTIKFLVNKLKIAKVEEKVKMISDDVNLKTIDLVMSGMGSIVGETTYSGVLETIQAFDEKFIKKWLIRDNVRHKMAEKLNKISLEEHYARLYGPTILAHQRKVHFVLKSIVPDVDILRMSQSGNKLMHNAGETLQDDTSLQNSKQNVNRNGVCNLSNVLMDKAILQRAFSGSAYEQTRRAEYPRTSSAGLSEDCDNLDDPHDHALRDRVQKTKAIWQSAFSQVSLQRRRRVSSLPADNENSNIIAENRVYDSVKCLNGSEDDTENIKHAYKQAKDKYRASEWGNLGHFNFETGNHLQDRIPKQYEQQSDCLQMRIRTINSSSKSVTKF